MTVASFIVGLGLGLIHLRLYKAGVESLMARPDPNSIQLAALQGTLFRFFVVSLAGICLSQIAQFDAATVLLGFVSVFFTHRAQMLKQAVRPEGSRA